jgi:hypothetical protein
MFGAQINELSWLGDEETHAYNKEMRATSDLRPNAIPCQIC